jgi:hypothetical protein
MSRADINERELEKLPNFYLYVDEFQSFANESFADILSEARKYKLNLTIAHQYIEQMSDEVRAAVFGNVGTMVSFRVGSYDAEVLEREFAPTFTSEDIVNLGAFQIYLRLMIDGIGSKPFSARTMPPLEKQDITFADDIITSSREKYGNPREEVEKIVREKTQHENTSKESKDNGNGNNSNGRNRGSNGNSNNHSNNDYSHQRREKKVLDADMANSLKAAIEKGKVKEVKEDSISLSEMSLLTKNGNSKSKKSKEPSTENSNALRDALKDVLGNVKEENKKESSKKENITKAEKKAERNNTNSPKEISEKELKDILGVAQFTYVCYTLFCE